MRYLAQMSFLYLTLILGVSTPTQAENLLQAEDNLMQLQIDSLYGVRDSLELSLRYIQKNSQQEKLDIANKNKQLVQLTLEIESLKDQHQIANDSLKILAVSNDSLGKLIQLQSNQRDSINDLKDALNTTNDSLKTAPTSTAFTKVEKAIPNNLKRGSSQQVKEQKTPFKQAKLIETKPSDLDKKTDQLVQKEIQQTQELISLTDYVLVGTTFIATFFLVLWQGKSSQH